MSTIVQRGGIGAAVLVTALVLSSVGQAAAPERTRTNVTGTSAIVIVFTDTVNIVIIVDRSISRETQGKEASDLIYNYSNSQTGKSGSGFCTLPAGVIVGDVTTMQGSLSINNINTSTLECSSKEGGSLLISNIEWRSNDFTAGTFNGEHRIVVNNPFDGTRFTDTGHGKEIRLAALAQVNIVGADIGLVVGTAGLNGTLGGNAEVSSVRLVSQTVTFSPATR